MESLIQSNGEVHTQGTNLHKPTDPSLNQNTFQAHDAQKERQEVDQTWSSGPRLWRAVRVDLVVSPYSQFAFAVLGWTGSKVN